MQAQLFYRDVCDVSYFPWMSINMPTAIACIYTPEGFVISADCKQGNKLTGAYSESATKIFRIGNSRLAYAVAGDVEIPLTEHAQFQFLRVAAEVFEKTPHGEFSQYTHEIKARISKSLNQARKAAQAPEISAWSRSPGELKVVLILAGYSSSNAPERRVFLLHPERPHFGSWEGGVESSEHRWFIGPEMIQAILRSGSDKRLAKYKIPHEEPSTIAEAKATAESYIRAFSDSEAREIDPDGCATVGERIHMATITRSEGFNWVDGFGPPPR